MGRTVRFDQVFVTSLDAAPRETDVLSGLASIDAGEITADKIEVANLVITNVVTANVQRTEFTGLTNVFRFTATQVGIGTDNPTNEFQLGQDSVIMNRNLQDIVTIQGNTVSTNLFATSTIKTVGDAFFADANASNVLKVTGNTFSTNLAVGTQLVVGTEVTPDTGANVAIFENGNVVVKDGYLQIFGDVDITGNLAITEIPAYTSVDNLVVSNAVILMGDGNNGTYDMAVLMHDQDGESNVFFGYTHTDDTMKLSRTTGGPTTANFTMDSANTVNLHVFGELYTQNNVGIANTSPTYSLSIGSNVYIDDVSSTGNVLYANGISFFEGLRIGDSGLTVGDLITLDADAAIPMVVTSTIQSDGLQTTGISPVGIANTSPTDTLSIGDKVFINTTSSNALTVIGNTATGRLITESIIVQDFIEVEGESGISSSANVIIHGDIQGGDSVSNTVSIRAGPESSNISAVEINGAKTSASHQNVILKTKNTERMRVSSNGNVGIANTAPTEKLTIGGNLRVNGSNAVISGTSTNYLKSYTDTTGTQTKIESRVGTGKGLNFYASTSDSMGVPKMTILETSNVGIGTTTPKGLLHTSGGTVLINGPLQYTNSFNNAGTPMIVSNTTSISNSTLDLANVMHLTREGTSVRDGVRATFKMGKYDLEVGKSRSKLDIFLSDDRYTSETEVLTLRADGRVGIGHTQPTAYLEVKCTGISNPETNGLLVHNHDNGDAIMAAQADSLEGNAFTSFILSDGANRSGWSIGVANNNDFRIAQNHEQVTDSAAVALYISDSDRNIGIGTDVPRGKLEVNGNVVIGNELYFGGLLSDEYGNTFIKERLVSTDISELLIFKGNEGPGAAGPDQIRLVGSQHVFQAYSEPQLSASDISDMEQGVSNLLKPAMLISGGGSSGRVLIGTTDTTKIQQPDTTSLFVNGGVEFAPGQKINFGNMDIYALSDGGRFETIGSSGDMRFQNKATAATQELFATESMRIKNTGLIGIGTTDPSTNVHIYSGVTSDIDVLKLESPGTNTKTGIRLNTNDGYGGYVRGYSHAGSVHGIVVGGMNNSVEADSLFVTHTSNVGIGTVNPSARFTVYNDVTRLEHSTSNAVLEFKTTNGVSNIYATPSGNVHVNPSSGDMLINSNLEVTGDLNIDGKIDLGNQVAVDLGGSEASTALHVGGGFISGSNEVACKRYSKSFTLGATVGKNIRLYFADGGSPEKMPAFYAKIVMMLRKIDGSAVRDMSTMVLEIQGGSHDGTTNNTLDDAITVGTKNLFGGDSDFPWNPNIIVGKRGIIITPHDVESGRIYKYDVHVELVTTSLSGTHSGGFLKNIKYNFNSPATQVDNFGAGAPVTEFTY
jgi:hypothetical protein